MLITTIFTIKINNKVYKLIIYKKTIFNLVKTYLNARFLSFFTFLASFSLLNLVFILPVIPILSIIQISQYLVFLFAFLFLKSHILRLEAKCC